MALWASRGGCGSKFVTCSVWASYKLAPTSAVWASYKLAPTLALPHFSQRRPDALLGLAGQTFLAALLAFEPLHRDQKPQRLWLAIDHGDRSFRMVRPGKLSWCGSKWGTPGERLDGSAPARPGDVGPVSAARE